MKNFFLKLSTLIITFFLIINILFLFNSSADLNVPYQNTESEDVNENDQNTETEDKENTGDDPTDISGEDRRDT